MMTSMTLSSPSRRSCPPALCDCQWQRLSQARVEQPRILLLSGQEEKRLLQRLENLSCLADLRHMQRRLDEQLGIAVQVAPGRAEVRSMRGVLIEVAAVPGLCRKTRQAIAGAIRRGLTRRPEIAYALLNAHDLFRDL
jgi:Trp operon repressor